MITSGSGEGISDNHSLLKRFLSSAMLGSMSPTPLCEVGDTGWDS